MSGIYFLKTGKLEEITEFYKEEIGCELWLEQEDCRIFKHGNMLFGFCAGEKPDNKGIITFFYNSKEDVDRMFNRFGNIAEGRPQNNNKYNIYHFFACDPEGRRVEFQYFDHPVTEFLGGSELLMTRRSIRQFEDKAIPAETMEKLWELCRYSPTSRNSQGYYFKIIKDTEVLKILSEIRGHSSRPIAASGMAVAICADPAIAPRTEADGHIAAYHFMLSAWNLGLGTCWIADMNRDMVKELLGIPVDHFIATITPLGFPSERNYSIPFRNESATFQK